MNQGSVLSVVAVCLRPWAVFALLFVAPNAEAQECDGTCTGIGCPVGVNPREFVGNACSGGFSYDCYKIHLQRSTACADLEEGDCSGGNDCVDDVEVDNRRFSGCGPDRSCDYYETCDDAGSFCFCENCGGAQEICGNGLDDDHDGIVDDPVQCGDPENPPDEPGDCVQEISNTSYAFGGMRLDPQLDVRLAGPGAISLEVVRYYASGMSTQFRKNNFGRRFSSTLNERLEGNLSSPPSDVVWFRTGGSGVGHASCSAQGSDYVCPPQVNRHHELRRLSNGSWRLTDLDGTVTTFDSAGRMNGKHDGAAGWGYAVSYDSSGHALSATDSAGRTLVFVHDADLEFLTGRDYIVRVELQRSPSNVVLAEYSYELAQLVSVERSTGTRTYEYDDDGVAITAVRENSGSTTIETHELDSTQRVIESHTADGAAGFRYDVVCNTQGPPGVLLFDLTAPELDGGGDPKTCTSDAQCSSAAGCHGGTCYWYSCAEYDPDHMRAISSITGNCACSGVAERSFTSGMRKAWETDRNGVRTTYEYDSSGLVIAECVNDDDTAVSRASPSSCPSTGQWTGTWYSSTYPGRPTEIRRSSVLSPGNWAKTQTYYDTNGRKDLVLQSGYTRGSSDTIVSYGNWTNYDYDSLGRLTKVDGPLSGTSDRVEYTYFGSGNGDSSYMLQRVRRYTSATSYLDTTYASYDAYGRPAQVTAPNGVTTSYAYDATGRVLSDTTASLTTSYAYDDGGRLEEVTLPRGNVILYRYDGWGRPSQIARRDSATLTDEDRVEMTYDAAGRLLTRSVLRQGESAWAVLQQAYDINGRLWRVYNPTDSGGDTYREITYDPVGLPTDVTDEAGNLVESFHDSFGRLSEVRRHLDGSGTNYLSTTYAFSSTRSRAPTTVTDGAGHGTTYERDDLDRLTKVVSPDAGTIRNLYDVASKLTDRWAADGLRSHFVYDSAGRLTWADHDYGSASAFTSDVKYTYDSASGCPTDITQKAAGRIARVDEELFADTSLGDGKYDRIVCLYYDDLGRTVRETTLGDEGVTRHTEYEYDGNGNLVRLRYPMITNAWARWDYDLASSDNTDADDAYRVAAETTKGSTYIYLAKASERYPMGPLRRVWHGNNSSSPPSNPSREVLRRLDSNVSTLRSHLGGSSSWDVLDRTYAYEPTMQIASFNDALSGNPDRYYDYDGAHRLTCATTSSVTSCPSQTDSRLLANVGYDAADNRSTFKKYSGISDSYVYTSGTDQLDKINHASQMTNYTLDGSGRRSYDDNTSISNDYRYYYYRADGRLRLVSGRRPSTNPSYQSYQLAYAYDYKGRRIFKSDKNLSTGVVHQWWFYYDQYDRLIGVRDIPNAASPTTYNVHIMFYLDGERVGRVVLKYVNGSFNQEQRDLFHDDHLQTPMALERWPTSGAASIVWSASYEPWGQANVAGGSSAVVDLRFPGQWYDGETESRVWLSGVNTLLRPGIAQNWMREYDAWVGAYSAVDPLIGRGLPVGPMGNRLAGAYQYASLDPAAIGDPRGLWPWDAPGSFDALVELLRDPDLLLALRPPPPAVAGDPAELCTFVTVIPAVELTDQGLCSTGDGCWVFDCGGGAGDQVGWVMAEGERPPVFVAEGAGPRGNRARCFTDSGMVWFPRRQPRP